MFTKFYSLVFAAPLPRNYIPLTSVIYPFDGPTWIALVLSLIAASVTLNLTANFQSENFRVSKISQLFAFWYTFSTLIGENLNYQGDTRNSVR